MSSNPQARFPRWALAVIGVISLLAAAILVLAVVLGVRAGQAQYQLQSRQQVAMALQRAIDFRSAGQLEPALLEYQRVLTLDPTNRAAQEGIQLLLAMAQGGATPPPAGQVEQPTAAQAASTPGAAVAPVAAAAVPTGVSSSDNVLRPAIAFPTAVSTPQAADAAQTPLQAALPVVTAGTPAAPLQAGILPGSALSTLSPAELETQANAAFRAGRWQEAVELLIQWQMVAGATQRPEVDQRLFEAYVNLATEKDNENNLAAALTLYDRALLLRPNDAAVRAERDLISDYLQVLAIDRSDPARAADLLLRLFTAEPDYRDVRARLQVALVSDGDRLIAAGDWCAAAKRYTALASVTALPDLLLRGDQIQTACDTGVPPAAPAGGAPAVAATPAAQPVAGPPGAGPSTGRLLYSVRDPVTGITSVLQQPVSGGASGVLLENAGQPALRSDGVRLVFRNLRPDQGGISAFDPATAIFFRMTDYTEDLLPSWDPQGVRVAFSSNREGDRRWRIYTVWAEENGAVDMLSYGESPAWSPVADLIVHRGCDDTGNGCGLWLMDGGGGNRRALTSVAGDTRPAWSHDGRVVVFMSDGRDGNMEIYRADTATGQVVRLTNGPAIDALPTVSPDGQWVAWISNADGAWKIYGVPLAGGAPRLIAPVKGELGDWHSQSLQWVN